MCGIAGLYSPDSPPSEGLLSTMIDTMVSRGPDAKGTFLDGAVGLAHRRLSIIDLKTGDQPMFNEDANLVLVFNGEIYDHAEHRRALEARGHVFSTESDSEVLLHLYEEHGACMVDRLNGMFAFAIYDKTRRSIFMARDRLGQKPLFYAHDGTSFAFASGLSALTSLEWLDTSYDADAFNLYLELNCIPAPHTVYRGAKKLPPGHVATFVDGNLTVEPYWRPSMIPDRSMTYEDACEAVRQRLTDAVRRRLVADVPLGMFLSGGMDSSLICAIAASLMDAPPKTFSIGFADARYDERKYAEMVAEEIGCDHHFLEVNPESLSMLETMAPRFEEPFADSSMLPTLLLAAFTANHVTVALSGDGADELFGGYYRYRAFDLFQRSKAIPKPLRRLLAKSGLALLPGEGEERTVPGKMGRLLRAWDADGLGAYARLTSRLRPHVKALVLGDRMRTSDINALTFYDSLVMAKRPSVDDVMTLDLMTYLPDDILVKVDRATMAHSLEARSPFLDPDVVDLALRLPYGFKQKGKTRKRILCDAFRDMLPNVVFTRPKMGFGVPVAAWLRGPWRTRTRELLLDGRMASDGVIDKSGVESLLAEHDGGDIDHSYAIFALVSFEAWLRGKT